MDPRHRPRRHRDADAGREAARRGEGTSREEIGREAFVERVWEWREQYGGTIIEQFKRLGASLRLRATSASRSTRATRTRCMKVFVDLYEKGLIYRDNYMVNWDPGSALGDLRPRGRGPRGRPTRSTTSPTRSRTAGEVVVATVRPGDDARRHRRRREPGRRALPRLVGKTAILPLVGRALPIIADEYVKPEFGTGALKITPGHDPNDFEIGRSHGLDEITVIGEDGRMTAAAGERFAGLTVARGARARSSRRCASEGRIAPHEPYTHTVPFSHRSGERIEPLISLQWFMRMDELAQPAIDVGARRPRARSTPSARRAATSTGWRTSARGASRASSGGATGCRSGTAARRRYVGTDAAGGRRLGARPRRARHVVLARRCGRSRRSAGRTRRRSCAPSTRPTCSRRRATSSSSGSRAW